VCCGSCLTANPSLDDCAVVAHKIVHNFVNLVVMTKGLYQRPFQVFMIQCKREMETRLLSKSCYQFSSSKGIIIMPEKHYTKYFLSQQKATELKWSHTVNIIVRVDCSISRDLHMEHLNRRLKYLIGNLGPNASLKAIERAAKSLGLCISNLKSRLVLQLTSHVHLIYFLSGTP